MARGGAAAGKPNRRFNVLASIYTDAARLPARNQQFFDRLQQRTEQLGVNTPAIAARVAEEINDVLNAFGSSSARLCAASDDITVGPG